MRYPIPGPAGGKLIREAIGLLKRHKVVLPLTSHILISASAGSDSTALAQLLLKYGRRIGHVERISLLHINHGWRGAESDADARFVEELAERWGAPCIIRSLAPPEADRGGSWEELARAERKKIYAELARNREAVVLTAHHADDLAETVLWRLLTGTADTHGGGIAVRHGAELRPLLGVRKELLREFLREEGIAWREDRTNHEGRFLRSRMRSELMPALEAIFPRAVENLARQALRVQANPGAARANRELTDEPLALLGAAGIRARRAHLESLRERLSSDPEWRGEVSLPDGWTLRRERSERNGRWVLEKA